MMNPRYLLLYGFTVLCLLVNHAYAQQTKIDSLLLVLKNAPNDTNKIVKYEDVVWEYLYSDPEKALTYATQELELAQKLNFKQGISVAENSIGIYYNTQGDFVNTLVHFLKSLKLQEELNDKAGLASSYCNIGNVYRNQQDLVKALEYYNKALKMARETKIRSLEATSLGNIGIVYAHQNDNDKALDHFLGAVKINEEIGNKRGMATFLGNVGLIYFEKGDNAKALECYSKAMQIDEEIGNKNDYTRQLCNIGSLYVKQKKYKEAGDHLGRSLAMAKEIGSKSLIAENYNHFYQLDSAQGNYKSALEDHKLFIAYRDSINNEEAREKNLQVSMQYDFDKKQAAIQAEQDKKDAIAEQEKRKQQVVTWAITGGLFLLLVIALIIFRSLRITQSQKKIISEKSDQLSEALRDVNASIVYAKRIQQAKLPKKEDINTLFNDNFILFRPKDIVSGDFYWMETVNDQVVFAACDCTGHGVPGAMVSVVCHNALNRAVREFGLIQPAAILDKTAEIVIENFSKSEEEIKDGMDISLCTFDPKTNTLQWAGANNPLWLVRNGELTEVKANKQPVGMHENNQPFTNHTFKLSSGDVLYLFTDGYADQFGGESGQKKLTRKRFKDLILSLQQKSLNEQGIELDSFIANYRKNVEQVDDILVMGVKV